MLSTHLIFIRILIHGLKLGSWSLLFVKLSITLLIGYMGLYMQNLKRVSNKTNF